MSIVLNGTSGITSPDFEGPTVGVTDGSSAAAGEVGEYISSTVSSGSAIGLTTNVTANVTSISLTAGDWDVSGVVAFATSAASATTFISGFSTTSAALQNLPERSNHYYPMTTATVNLSAEAPMQRFSVGSTTTVYLVTQVTFTAGTVSAYGRISARRVR